MNTTHQLLELDQKIRLRCRRRNCCTHAHASACSAATPPSACLLDVAKGRQRRIESGARSNWRWELRSCLVQFSWRADAQMSKEGFPLQESSIEDGRVVLRPAFWGCRESHTTAVGKLRDDNAAGLLKSVGKISGFLEARHQSSCSTLRSSITRVCWMHPLIEAAACMWGCC